ncbi:hypothetical protein LTR37_007278 [Vermiconidia calcicola]|uniref:Uncharacterized protein n=1 Tax=Vermiconidia calcicola TaxID=1690605 RepID=A0ACC3NEZ0_9PEZI|nr:hypothetical protein LTR37_007278 [Vermiconidia calcicola]
MTTGDPGSTNGASRKRAAPATPDSQPAQKRQHISTHDHINAVTDLAFAHLENDDPSHPLYGRNVEHIVNSRSKVNQKDSTKAKLVEHQITSVLARRVLNELGSSVAGILDVSNRGRSVNSHHDAPGYRMDLSIKPVLQLEDDDADGGARVTQAVSKRKAQPEIKTSNTHQTAKPAKPAVDEGDNSSEEEDSESEYESEDDEAC